MKVFEFGWASVAGLLARIGSTADTPQTVAPPTITVINKGVGGRNTPEAVTALEKDVLSLKPRHVILYFGMNDAMNSGKLVPLPDYEKNMRSMVRRLADAGVKTIALVTLNPVIEPYVQARHPKHPRTADLQACLTEYDRAIRRIAAEETLPLIDLRKIVADNGGTTNAPGCLIRCEANGGGKDGVHLIPAAYEKLGTQAYEMLKSSVQPGDTIVCFGDSLTYGAGVKGQGTTTGETYPAVLQRAFRGRN
jgi:lysophospholipase L1-like esterase